MIKLPKDTINKFNLSNSLSVVTGGSGLLGVKHVEALLDADSDVVVLDINESEFATHAASIHNKYNKEVTFIQCDIGNEDSVIAAKNNIYKIYNKYPDILVNNAAIDAKFDQYSNMKDSRLEYFSLDRWKKELSVGLTGTFICCKIFGEQMSIKRKGVIVNIASHYGLVGPDQRIYGIKDDVQEVKPVSYPVVKHAVIGLTRYLATYWAKNNIRCNALAPGGVFNNHDDNFVRKFCDLIPMNRMAEPDEYKASLLYLCSDGSSYMNGEVLVVDGGLTTW